MPIPLIAQITPKNNGAFALVDDKDIRGGFQVSPSYADMLIINTDNRKVGMQVYCQDTRLTYQLQSDLNTWSEIVASGGSSGTTVYIQTISASVWNINHNLDKYPTVFTEDSVGREVKGDLDYVDANNLTVTFNYMFSGKAYLN